MKRALALILCVVMLIAISAGCEKGNDPAGGNGTAGGGQIDPNANYLKEYKSTFSKPITTMNPYTTTGTSDYIFIANLVDGLVETDRYDRVVGALAESWEHNEDYSVWTFYLRQGVRWVDHTGAETDYEVTAEDFVSGIRYVADPNHAASSFSTIRSVISGLYDYYYLLVDVDDGTETSMTREQAEAAFEDTVGVKALDKYTVQYTLSGSYPYFLSYAQLDLMLPVNQAFLDAVGDEFGIAKEKMLYNGGYYISQWDLDKMVVLSKNTHYWDPDSLTVDTLSWEYVSDGISSLEMFERGNITSTSLSSEEVASVRGSEWEDYVYLSEKTVTTFWYSFNFATDNPEMAAAVQNENFRKAIFTAIDSVTVSAIWEPNDPAFFCRFTLLPENCMFDENGKDYTDYDALKPYKGVDPFSAETARAYMEQAAKELCESDGVTLKGVAPGDVDMLPITQFHADGKLPIDIVYSSSSSDSEMKKATLVKQMLETYLGTDYVNVILGYSSNSFSADVYDLGNWDLVDDSYGFRYADPSANLDRCTSDYDITYSFYDVPEFDSMVERATAIYDINERYEAYSQAEAWLLEHAYIKPYMSGGGSYKMTRIVPYTVPGGYFGMSRFKMKGALIREDPITAAEYAAFTETYNKEKAAFSN
ncbi:MAG: peptide ABC transporter substrate-binding protein [Clostridia bacterium]|nr:peptide ABC transporter substrate-binding protein [Clostridia bacterium]